MHGNHINRTLRDWQVGLLSNRSISLAQTFSFTLPVNKELSVCSNAIVSHSADLLYEWGHTSCHMITNAPCLMPFVRANMHLLWQSMYIMRQCLGSCGLATMSSKMSWIKIRCLRCLVEMQNLLIVTPLLSDWLIIVQNIMTSRCHQRTFAVSFRVQRQRRQILNSEDQCRALM